MGRPRDERIHQARRDAIRNRLIGNTGQDRDVAETWWCSLLVEISDRGADSSHGKRRKPTAYN